MALCSVTKVIPCSVISQARQTVWRFGYPNRLLCSSKFRYQETRSQQSQPLMGFIFKRCDLCERFVTVYFMVAVSPEFVINTAGGNPATGAKVHTGVPACATAIRINPHIPMSAKRLKRFLFIIRSL